MERAQLLISLEPLAEPFGMTLPPAQWDSIADEDWSLSWKQHWQADPVGDRADPSGLVGDPRRAS